MRLLDLAFWAAAGFIAYTYVGYPLIVWLLARLRRSHVAEPDALDAWPALTVVVAVHNERGRIARKLANLRSLDYPNGGVRLLFVADGCTDGTDAALAAETDIDLISYMPRRGKPYALNQALQRVTTPLVVFTDVRQMLDVRALRFLVAHLADPAIGAVSGELVHLDPATHAAANIGLYWRYEKWIRKSESRLNSTVGATGALYAIRRADWQPLAEDTLLDDFVVPMRIARSGRRVLFEGRALVYDELQADAQGEQRRKVRTLTGNFQVAAAEPWMLLPWRNPLWWQFVSHKLARLIVPYALALLFVLSLAGVLLTPSIWYAIALATQCVFYGSALAGLRFSSVRRFRLISFGAVFVALNWAAVLAMRNFLSGRVDARWEKTS